jgi:hypothetical protein
MGMFTKITGAWQEIGVSAVGSTQWAQVTGGTVTTYTKPDGAVMEVHTFTASGTLTVETPGYAEVLVVGGGGGGKNDNANAAGGGAGAVRWGMFSLPAGSLAATVGNGGAIATTGGLSSLGAVLKAGGGEQGWAWRSGAGANAAGGGGASGGAAFGSASQANYAGGGSGGTVYGAAALDGVTLAVTGAAVEYARGGPATGATSTAKGSGGSAGGGSPTAGVAGVVIVAVQKSAPTVSGVVATGGTVTEYTGDGVNGVLGQTYKVHKFTANGTLTVTAGGEIDVLLVAGGGYGDAGAEDCGGGGGGMLEYLAQKVSAGTLSATVGGGGQALGQPGGDSALGWMRVFRGGGGNLGNSGNTVGGSGGGGAGTGAISGQGYPGVMSGTYKGGGGAGGPGVAGDGGPGRVSYMSGSAVTYARGGSAAVNVGTPANSGNGGWRSGPGASGIVIVRYKV